MSDIKSNLQKIKKLINDAEEKSARSVGSVKLMAVSKFHPQQAVEEAIECGQLLFGENRVQEAVQKFTPIPLNGELAVYRQQDGASVGVCAGEFYCVFHAALTILLHTGVLDVLFGAEDLLEDVAKFHLAHVAASFHVGEHALQVADTLRKTVHFAKTFIDLLQSLADKFEGFVEAGFESLFKFVVN